MILSASTTGTSPVSGATDVAALVSPWLNAVTAASILSLSKWPPLMAEVDADQVEQILENLLENAFCHTPPGTPVWVQVGEAPGTLDITVEDAGPGVPDDYRETVSRCSGPVSGPMAELASDSGSSHVMPNSMAGTRELRTGSELGHPSASSSRWLENSLADPRRLRGEQPGFNHRWASTAHHHRRMRDARQSAAVQQCDNASIESGQTSSRVPSEGQVSHSPVQPA